MCLLDIQLSNLPTREIEPNCHCQVKSTFQCVDQKVVGLPLKYLIKRKKIVEKHLARFLESVSVSDPLKYYLPYLDVLCRLIPTFLLMVCKGKNGCRLSIARVKWCVVLQYLSICMDLLLLFLFLHQIALYHVTFENDRNARKSRY